MHALKKRLGLLLSLVLIVLISACGAKHTDAGTVFLGRIEAMEGSLLTVTPEITTKEYKKSKTLTVDNAAADIFDSAGNKVGQSSLGLGMEIYITYSEQNMESTEGYICATHIQLKDLVIESAAPTESPRDVLTYSLNGETETIYAKKILLKDCSIKVPMDGWEESVLDDAGYGPVEIYNENHAKVSIMQKNLSLDEAENYYNERYGNLEWKNWARDITLGYGYGARYAEYVEEDQYLTFYISECATGTILLESYCPNETADGTGSLLQSMANSLYVNPEGK